jgi:hypothetical protein
MPSWDMERWDDDYLASGAGRYQEAHENLSRLERVLGVQPPDGWRTPMETVCRVCWYTVVAGVCVRGCTSLSGRGTGEPGGSASRVGLGGHTFGSEPAPGAPRPESDAEAA